MIYWRNIFIVATLFAAALSLSACAATQETPDTPYVYASISVAGKTATPAERKQCEAAGGVIERAGRAGYERCTQSLPDGFKVCTDSDQCLGKCVLNRPGNFPPGTPTDGICAMTDNPFGCQTYIENGRTEPTLCVD